MIREFHNINLAKLNSFGVEQHALRLVEFENEDDLRQIFAAGAPEKWTVLAGGNNILFTRDYDGLLIMPVAQGIDIMSDDGDAVRVRVQAGVEWDDLVQWAVGRGLWGIENLSLIPGKAGAAPIQNIGAYGCEVKDVIECVHTFCVEKLNTLALDAAHCSFAYRDSIFKRTLRGSVVITAVDIRLQRTPAPKLGYGDVEREVEQRGGASLRNIRDAVCAIRRGKLPDPAQIGNAGSFFKNPVVDIAVAERLRAQYPDMPLYPAEGAAVEGIVESAAGSASKAKLAAGWLVDRAGLKGYVQGRVGVHPKQALVLVNMGGATGREVADFARMVQDRVRERFGVELETEVNIL